MATKRVFIAHPKAMDDSDLGRLKQDVEEVFKAGAGGHKVEVTLGRTDYSLHFARCGGWDAWAADVGAGVHYITRQPRYHAIVVPEGPVGMATAKIVEAALAAKKRVFEFGPAGLRRVTTITRVSNDFRNGWRLGVQS